MQPTLGGALDAGYVGSLERSVNLLGANGIKSMLDVHNMGHWHTGTTDINSGTVYNLGDANLTSARFNDLWVRLSNVFKSNTYIYGYDLMNEPEAPITDGVWATVAQSCINAIRANGDNQKIIIEGRAIGNTDWATVNPSFPLTGTNLEYSAHFYPDPDGSGTNYSAADAQAANMPTSTLVTRSSAFKTWVAANGVKANIGEVNVGQDGSYWMDELDLFLADAKTYDAPVFAWYFDRLGGPDAYNLYPMGGKQARQWPVMAKFNNITGLPTAVSLVGPSTSYRSQAQSITLDFRGTVPANATWTFSDGGAGGSFSPATVSMTTGGYNFFPTVTYTPPASDQTVTISATNNAGLTNPASITITVSGAIPAPPTYVAPTLDSTASTKAALFRTGQYIGGTTLADFLSGTGITTNANGVVTDRSITPSAALAAILTAAGPATVMVEVSSMASVTGRIIGGIAAIPNGTFANLNQIMAFLSKDGAQFLQTTSIKKLTQTQRIVLSWDNTEVKAAIGGSTIAKATTTAGFGIDFFGSEAGGTPFFNHEIVSIAIWSFKGTDAGVVALSNSTTP